MPPPLRQQTLIAHDATASHQAWISVDNGPWLACASGTYREAWDKLLLIESKGRTSDRIVLPTGQLPTSRR